MRALKWLARWTAILAIPYLVWTTFLQIVRLLLPDGIANPDFFGIALLSGTLISLLAVISLGFLAQKSGSPTHFANVLTGSLVANYVLNDAFSEFLSRWPHIGLPALVVAIGLAFAVWLRRKRKYEAS